METTSGIMILRDEMIEAKGGSGEVGVYIRSKEKYHEPVEEAMIPVYVKTICRYHSVPEPIIEIGPPCKRRWGTYHPKQCRIVLNYLILGILLHELAHHINHSLNYRDGRGHNAEFKSILSDLFEWWEV